MDLSRLEDGMLVVAAVWVGVLVAVAVLALAFGWVPAAGYQGPPAPPAPPAPFQYPWWALL